MKPGLSPAKGASEVPIRVPLKGAIKVPFKGSFKGSCRGFYIGFRASGPESDMLLKPRNFNTLSECTVWGLGFRVSV